jgi:hypothetical protein
LQKTKVFCKQGFLFSFGCAERKMIRFTNNYTLPLHACLLSPSSIAKWATLAKRDKHYHVDNWHALAPFLSTEEEARTFFTSKEAVIRYYYICLYFLWLVEYKKRPPPFPEYMACLATSKTRNNDITCVEWFWNTCQQHLKTDEQRCSLFIILFKTRQQRTVQHVVYELDYTRTPSWKAIQKFELDDFLSRVYRAIYKYVYCHLADKYTCQVLSRGQAAKKAALCVPYFMTNIKWDDVSHFEQVFEMEIAAFPILVLSLRMLIMRRFLSHPLKINIEKPYKFAFYSS